MSRFRLVFLVSVALLSSGYRFRCYWMCTDQTAIQNDYIEERDRCRQYAQLKLDMAAQHPGGPTDDKSRKATLVSLFAECMSQHGWTVPDAKVDTKPMPASTPAAAAAAAAPPPAAAVAAAPSTAKAAASAQDKLFLSRSSECAFARYAATTSSNAALRAKACDLECAQRLKAAPETPRPAACPAEVKAGYGGGVERDE